MSASVIASALLTSANLSISSPDQYHYVSIPTNMEASVEGVGMGADAPTDENVQLRYEDAAFLTEAYVERANLLDGSTNINYDVGESLASPAKHYASAFKDGYTNGVYVISPCGYVSTTNGMANDVILYTTKNSTYAYDAMIPILGGETYPFPQPSVEDADLASDALSAKTVASLYDDLAKFTRAYSTAFIRPYGGTSNTLLTVTEESDYIPHYDSFDGKWVYPDKGVNAPTITTDTGTYRMTYALTLTADKSKKRGWKLVSDEKGNSEWKDQTGVKDFAYTKTETATHRTQGVAKLNYCHPVGTNVCKYATLYGYGCASYARDSTKEGLSSGFVIKLCEGSLQNDGTMAVSSFLTPAAVETLAYKAVSALKGDAIWNASGLLSDMDVPATPSEDHESYTDQTVSDQVRINVSIEKFFVVMNDLVFNARVKGDGE